ncbi:MAG TPA: hypothetical protein VEC13_00290 [Candidatus Paceibacterota bacterium]|nr:hypothetical protein [Candidatus Paceibacterota bacterium]
MKTLLLLTAVPAAYGWLATASTQECLYRKDYLAATGTGTFAGTCFIWIVWMWYIKLGNPVKQSSPVTTG